MTFRALAGRRAAVSTHVVEPGESFFSISARYNVSPWQLARVNRVDLTDVIHAGQRLALPRGARVSTPGMSTGSASRDAIRAEIDYWARHYGVDASLARALAWMESGFQQDVVSNVGAIGVMQLLPETWEFVDIVLLGFRTPRTYGATSGRVSGTSAGNSTSSAVTFVSLCPAGIRARGRCASEACTGRPRSSSGSSRSCTAPSDRVTQGRSTDKGAAEGFEARVVRFARHRAEGGVSMTEHGDATDPIHDDVTTNEGADDRLAAHERLATGSLARWARMCASNPWKVVIAWVGIIAALIVLVRPSAGR